MLQLFSCNVVRRLPLNISEETPVISGGDTLWKRRVWSGRRLLSVEEHLITGWCQWGTNMGKNCVVVIVSDLELKNIVWFEADKVRISFIT